MSSERLVAMGNRHLLEKDGRLVWADPERTVYAQLYPGDVELSIYIITGKHHFTPAFGANGQLGIALPQDWDEDYPEHAPDMAIVDSPEGECMVLQETLEKVGEAKIQAWHVRWAKRLRERYARLITQG